MGADDEIIEHLDSERTYVMKLRPRLRCLRARKTTVFMFTTILLCASPLAFASPASAASCKQSTKLEGGASKGYVWSAIETKCNEPVLQQVEACMQQKYEGSWHSSGTCVTSEVAETNPLYTYSGEITCTTGRYYRAWSWWYRAGETSTDLVPSEGGTQACGT
jgi:hypothetical protein